MSNQLRQSLKHKTIHLIPHDGVGGVEVAARSMLNSDFLNDNFKLFFIAGKSLSTNKKNVIESPFRSTNNPIAYFRAVYKIYRKAPDILICSLWKTTPIGLLVKLFKPKTKLVFFLHFASTIHLLDTFLHKLMMLFSNYIWADSLATLDARVHNVGEYNTSIISFVTSKLSPKKKPGKPVSLHFVFWGRLNKQKGLDRAIRFIKVLDSAGFNCKYDIWGRDDGELDRLVNLVNELELSSSIKFKGLADYSELQKISSQQFFYLQFSRNEGMAMSVLEAMQLGLVPIVTPVGEIRNYCTDKKNSIVVHDVDKFNESVSFLISVLNDRVLFDQLRDGAINTWKGKPLYENDFISAANDLFHNY